MGKKDKKKKTAIKRVIKNKPKEVTKKKKQRVTPLQGKMFVTASFNNTIVTASDLQGNVLGWSSTGKMGFKGARKSTPYAATKAVEDLVGRLVEKGLKQVDVIVSGPGMGRDSSVRAIKNGGLKITSLADVTPIPHNGCRPKGQRRV